jgi:hypothetical protein
MISEVSKKNKKINVKKIKYFSAVTLAVCIHCRAVQYLLCLTTAFRTPRVWLSARAFDAVVTGRVASLLAVHEYRVSGPNGETNRSWPRRELSRLKNSSFSAERFKRTLKCIITY